MLLPEETNNLEAVALSKAGLSGAFFTDQRLFDVERQVLFIDTWACVAAADDVASGSVWPVEIAGQPLLVTRDRHGILRCFFNTCSHRGTILVEGGQQKCTRIVCPYHAWSYDLEGKLRSTPHIGGANVNEHESINPAGLGLRPVEIREWAGLVFVNISGTAEPFEDYIRAISERLEKYDLSQLKLGTATRAEAKANWKIVVENFVESYHLPWIHSDMNRYNPMEDHYQILGGRDFVGQGLKNMRPTDKAANKLPPFPNLTPDQMAEGESHFLFPNLMFGVLADYMYAIILFPESPEITKERLVILFNGEAAARSPENEELREVILRRMADVNNEDMGITEKVQAGRRASSFTGGKFVPLQEKTSEQFQQGIATRLLNACGHDISKFHFQEKEIHHMAK